MAQRPWTLALHTGKEKEKVGTPKEKGRNWKGKGKGKFKGKRGRKEEVGIGTPKDSAKEKEAATTREKEKEKEKLAKAKVKQVMAQDASFAVLIHIGARIARMQDKPAYLMKTLLQQQVITKQKIGVRIGVSMMKAKMIGTGVIGKVPSLMKIGRTGMIPGMIGQILLIGHCQVKIGIGLSSIPPHHMIQQVLQAQ